MSRVRRGTVYPNRPRNLRRHDLSPRGAEAHAHAPPLLSSIAPWAWNQHVIRTPRVPSPHLPCVFLSSLLPFLVFSCLPSPLSSAPLFSPPLPALESRALTVLCSSQRHIVHRDLKPQNCLLVNEKGARGLPPLPPPAASRSVLARIGPGVQPDAIERVESGCVCWGGYVADGIWGQGR
jgi:hypothetical protein